MKKILLILISLILLTGIFTTVCFAAEADSMQESETVFSRLWEYVDTYSEQIVSYIADIILVVIAALIAKKGKSISTKLIGSISKCASEDTQTDVVSVLNSIIQELNAEHAENAELKNMIALLKTDLSNVHKETRAIFDAMLSVWGNSKNLPQGIKDLLTLTYSTCLKSEEEAATEVSENDERKAD